jgi:hypothetical protein
MRAAVALVLLALAACASAPAPPSCGEGAAAPRCTATFPDQTPRVDMATDVADARAALVKACPPAVADDPTPGLSYRARSDDARPHRWCPALPDTEVAALYGLLQQTPPRSPDRPKILSRIAVIAFALERSAHADCRQLAVAPEPPPDRRAAFVEEAEHVIRSLYRLRSFGEDTCTRLLREHPDAVPAICAQ